MRLFRCASLLLAAVLSTQLALSPVALANDPPMIPHSLQIRLADALIEKKRVAAMELNGEDATEAKALVQQKATEIETAVTELLQSEKSKRMPVASKIANVAGIGVGVLSVFGIVAAAAIGEHYIGRSLAVLVFTVAMPTAMVSTAVLTTRVVDRIQKPHFYALIEHEFQTFFDRLRERGFVLAPESIRSFVESASGLELKDACELMLVGPVGTYHWLDDKTERLLGPAALGPGRWRDETLR